MSRALWHEAYEEQMALWRFWASPHGPRYARSWVEDWKRKGKPWSGGPLDQAEKAKLWQGDPVVISPDMFKLVEHHAPSMPVEPLHEEDFFTHTGFLWLPEAVYDTDIHGKTCAYRALTWGRQPVLTVPPDVQRTYFLDQADVITSVDDLRARWTLALLRGDRADVPDGVELDIGVHVGVYSDWRFPDDWSDDDQERQARMTGTPLSLLHFFPLRFGHQWDAILVQEDGSEVVVDVGWTNPANFLRAFLRIADQTIASRRADLLPRPSRKRAKRIGMPEQNYITVVTLRRERQPGVPNSEPTGGGREYTHRWWVDAYWRKTWYASQQRHRWQLVAGSVRGPEDKPFVPRGHHAYQVKR